jgi:hypothetical protein
MNRIMNRIPLPLRSAKWRVGFPGYRSMAGISAGEWIESLVAAHSKQAPPWILAALGAMADAAEAIKQILDLARSEPIRHDDAGRVRCFEVLGPRVRGGGASAGVLGAWNSGRRRVGQEAFPSTRPSLGYLPPWRIEKPYWGWMGEDVASLLDW